MNFCGVDPGRTGAIAVLNGEAALMSLIDMPWVGKDLDGQMLRQMLQELSPLRVAIEGQHAFPKQGASSAFTNGVGFGMLRGLVIALAVPHLVVTANVWKRAVGLAPGSDKHASRMVASRLFPLADLGRRADQGRADALLIAEYLRRLG